jgi:hypothetical protein
MAATQFDASIDAQRDGGTDSAIPGHYAFHAMEMLATTAAVADN